MRHYYVLTTPQSIELFINTCPTETGYRSTYDTYLFVYDIDLNLIDYNDDSTIRPAHHEYRQWLSTLHTVMLHDTIISQDEYDCLISEFIQAVEDNFPNTLIQFEDFGKFCIP